MPTLVHEKDDASKLVELNILAGLEGMLREKLAHLFQDRQVANPQTGSITVVLPDDPSAEEPLEGVENLLVSLMLDDHKLWQDLITDGHLIVTVDADMKAALSVDEPDDPICGKLHKNLC